MSTRRFLLAAALAAWGWFLNGHAGPAWGAQYTWVGDSDSYYTGYWDTTIGNNVWQSGSSSVAWSNSPVNDALFATYPATVYIDGAVTVGNMTFEVDGSWLYSESGDSVTLAGLSPTINVATGSADMYLSLAGTSGMTKSGSGTLELEWPNSYSGSTIITGGVLRLSDPNALPGGTATAGGTSNLLLNGGVVELASGDFTRGLGTGASQVQFGTAGGGFSASGGSQSVNLGGNSATLTWGNTAFFLPNGAALMLGSPSNDSLVDFQNPINLGSTTRTVQVMTSGYATVDARLSGTLSGSGTGGLTMTGDGVLELTASNSYGGTTTVSGGVLRLSNSAALPGGTGVTGTGGNLTLDGGVVELAAGDFTRGLGSGPGQVQLTASGGGFSAAGANRVVNLGGNSASLTWGSTAFFLPNGATLMLGSPSDNSLVDFQNPINLGSTTQTIHVMASGYTTVDARLSGMLSGSGTAGLTITGDGVLELTASNAYGGTTTVSGGVLRLSNSAALPGGTGVTGTGGNLTLDGGVVELAAGDFTRGLGSGPGQVQLTASGGGFSAAGANRVVNLGGNSASLTWGSTAFFLPNGATLMLGSPSDNSLIDFQNPINLGGTTQTIQVMTSGYTTVDARLSGTLSGSGTAGLTITGDGVLELTASNAYGGTTTVSGGVLRLSNSAACRAAPG